MDEASRCRAVYRKDMKDTAWTRSRWIGEMVCRMVADEVLGISWPSILTYLTVSTYNIDFKCLKMCGLVSNYMTENRHPFAEWVGLGTDGAAVNSTIKKIIDTEVSKQAGQEHIVKAVGQHCADHNLNLAAAQSGNCFIEITNFKHRQLIAYALNDYYKNSTIFLKKCSQDSRS